jgi:hypothetical protein
MFVNLVKGRQPLSPTKASDAAPKDDKRWAAFHQQLVNMGVQIADLQARINKPSTSPATIESLRQLEAMHQQFELLDTVVSQLGDDMGDAKAQLHKYGLSQSTWIAEVENAMRLAKLAHKTAAKNAGVVKTDLSTTIVTNSNIYLWSAIGVLTAAVSSLFYMVLS